MTPNRTNHPSRKGIEIEKHKGGRTARLGARFTEVEKAAIMAAARAAGLSVSDYIMLLSAPEDGQSPASEITGESANR